MSNSPSVTAVSSENAEDLSFLLRLAGDGDETARAELFREVYYELRRMAEMQMLSQPVDLSIEATGLVHAAFIKLMQQKRVEWTDRRHFLAVCAVAMRSILVDHARRKRRRKRSAPGRREPLDGLLNAYEGSFVGHLIDLVDLDWALDRLKSEDPEAWEVVHLRFFLQMPMDTIRDELGTPLRTVERCWYRARNRLFELLEDGELGSGADDPSGPSTDDSDDDDSSDEPSARR